MEFRRFALLFLALSTPHAFAGDGDPIYTPELPVDENIIIPDSFNAGIDKSLNRYSMSMALEGNMPVAATLDLATDSIYVARGTSVQAFTFTQVAIEMYPGNTALQGQAIEEFRQLSQDRTGILSYQERQDPGSKPFNPYPFDCDLSPCSPAWYNGYGTQIRIDLRPPYSNEPDLSGWSPEIIAYDRASFERAREEACDDQTDAAIGAGLSIGAAMASCGTSEFGLPAIACGASIGAIGLNMRQMSRNERTCRSRYPGPGKW